MVFALVALFRLLLLVAIACNGYFGLVWRLPFASSRRLRVGGLQLATPDRVLARSLAFFYFECAVGALLASVGLVEMFAALLGRRLPQSKQLRLRTALTHVWSYFTRPLTIILLMTSVTSAILAWEETGFIKIDVANFFTRVFHQLLNEFPQEGGGGQESLLRYLEGIQRSHACCGATSIADWLALRPGSDGFEWSPAAGDVYIPASCLDPRKNPVLPQERIWHLQQSLKALPRTELVAHLPVFQRGCIEAVGDRVLAEFYDFLITTILIDVSLNVCLLIVSFVERRKVPPLSSGGVDRTRKWKYISNARLLQAIQGTPLLSRPVPLQEARGSAKAEWVEKRMRIGWCLRNNGEQSAEYIRRIYTRRCEAPGQIKTSAFRRFLRTYLPLVEAVLYTDGDSRHEVEGNDFYGGFTATVLRVICCGLYGYFGAHILIAAFITKYKANSAEGDIAKNVSVVSDAGERKQIVEELAYMTSILVRIIFVIAAIISRRFRCFLALLGPNLGLTAGQSFIAAELANVAVYGPVRGLATNLRAAGGSLNCLMKLAGNITNDANQMLKPSGKEANEEDIETEGEEEDEEDEKDDEEFGVDPHLNATQQNFTQIQGRNDSSKSVKYPKLKNLSGFHKFFEKVMKMASRGIKRGASQLRKLTDKVHAELTKEPDADSEAAPPPQNVTNKAVEADIQATNAGVSESFRRHLEELDVSERERMRIRRRMLKAKMDAAVKNFNLNLNESKILNSALFKGNKIESNMRSRLTKACVAMQQARTEQCNVAAVTACYRIQTSAVITTGLPLFIGPWCASYVTKGTACPTGEALEKAKSECGSSGYSIGLKDGFGVHFAVAQSGLEQFAENFKIVVGYRKLKSAAAQVSALSHKAEDAIEQLGYLTLDATRAIFAIILLFSTLLKLLFLILLIKTQKYITNYLKDMDFDNIYVEGEYEKIDERRKKESRMYLLPLKSHERKTVFWHKLGYTKAEWVRAATAVVKSTVLGIGLTMLFIADSYLHSLMVVLDVVTQGELRLGGSTGKSDTAAAAMFFAGDGFAAEMVKGILDGLLNLMNLDFSYKLSSCAPKVILSSYDLRVRFGILWTTLLLLGISSGYLLRLRHVVTGFFYPIAHRRRQMHLYNTMLANRARDLSTRRNLLIQRVRENSLQQEVRLLSRPPLLAEAMPKLAKVAKLRKGTCVICRDVQKPGPGMYICPVDACATCRQCQLGISDDPEFCVACLDRNEASLEDTLKSLETMYKNKHPDAL